MPVEKQVPIQDTRQQNIQTSFNDMILQQPIEQYVTHQSQPPPYSSVISKSTKSMKSVSQSRGKLQQNIQTVYSKSMDNIYPTYSQQNVSNQIMVSDRICRKFFLENYINNIFCAIKSFIYRISLPISQAVL